MMQGAWSITEVTRYGYHVLSELVHPVPRWAVLIRYSTFIVLYPTGFSGECLSIIHVCSPLSHSFFHHFSFLQALPYLRITTKNSIYLPNPLNLSFHIHFISVLYVTAGIPSLLLFTHVDYYLSLVFFSLYKHMFRQRRKHLNPPPSSR